MLRFPSSSPSGQLMAALPFLVSLVLASEEPVKPPTPPPVPATADVAAPPAPSAPKPGVVPQQPAPVQPPSAPAGGPSTPQTQSPPLQPAVTAQDFLRLWNESKLEEQILRQRPPVEGVIRSASYKAAVLGSPERPTGVTIQATLQLQSFQKGWSVVPISSQPLPLLKSETGNAFLTLKDQGYVVLLPDLGNYEIQLTLAFPVNLVEGTPTVEIKLPQSPISSVDGSLPGTGWAVKTTRDLFPIRTTVEGGETRFSFSPGAVTAFQLQWENPAGDKASEPVIFAETKMQMHLRPDAVRSDATLSLQLPRAPISSIKLWLSSDHELLSVAGEGVKTWKLQKEAAAQWLEVWFSSPRRDRSELSLSLEQSVPQLPFTATLPVVRVEGALRQGGSIELVEEQDVTTSLDAIQNLTRQASSFHAAPHQRHLGSYRFLRSDYSAALKLSETTPQISASADTLFHLDDAICSFASTLRLEVEGRAILQSVIVPPAGFSVEKVEGDGVRSFDLKGSRLTVSYLTPQLGTIQLEVTGKKPRREGAVEEQELPHFTVENALEFRGRIRLDFPPSIQVETRNETSPMALQPVPSSFEYLNTPSPASLVVTRKAPQVEVDSTSEVHFKHHETTIHCSLKYQIRNRFPDRLLLRMPASLAGQVEFHSPTLVIMDRNASLSGTSAARSEDEGLFAYWALHDPNKALGEHQVELTITEKLPDPLYNQPLITPSVLLLPLQVERLDGRLNVSLDENVVLKPATETGMRAVTGEPASPGRGPSFVFSSSDADLTFAVTRLRYVELPSLAVDFADVTHVVSGDGSISSEMACRVIAERPADLEIQLPPGARMSSQVFCNDSPIAPRQTTEENLVAVTIDPEKNPGKSGESIVRFTYDVPSPLASRSLGSRGDLPVPVATLRNARTLDSRTTLFLPPAYRFFGFESPMTLLSNVPGWTRAKEEIVKLLPSLKPWLGANGEASAANPATGVASIPPFEYRVPLRREGQLFAFTYSAAPDAIAVSYISQRYAILIEAGAFFLALFLGILISRQSLEAKLVFLVFAGILALVAASLAPPHMAAVYYAVCLGAVSSVVIWIFAGVVLLFQGLFFRAAGATPPGAAAFPAFPEPDPMQQAPSQLPAPDLAPPQPEPSKLESSAATPLPAATPVPAAAPVPCPASAPGVDEPREAPAEEKSTPTAEGEDDPRPAATGDAPPAQPTTGQQA